MDPIEDSSFYVTLSSRSSEKNSAGDFTVRLSEPLVFGNSVWHVALTKIIYDREWTNIKHRSGKVFIYHPHTSGDANIHLTHTGWQKIAGEKMLEKLKNTKASPATAKYIITVFDLRPGYYQSPKDIGESIQREFIFLRQPYPECGLPLHFKYERNEKCFSMHGPAAFVFEDSEPFLKVLGLENEVIELDDKHKMFIGNLNGRNGKMTGVVDTLYLYSELLFERNYVGDVKTHFVTAVPVSGLHGDTVHYEPINPEYKNVLRRKEITDIDIKIRDVFGEPVPFEPGTDTVVVLHFKRVEPLD